MSEAWVIGLVAQSGQGHQSLNNLDRCFAQQSAILRARRTVTNDKQQQ